MTKNLTKQDKKNILKSLVPVFKLKMCALGNRSQCKFSGYVGENEKIYDDMLPSQDDNRKETFGQYELTYITTHCNISGSFLLKNNKLPVLCKSASYSRKFLSGNIFNVFLYFTLDDATITNLTNPTQYVNRLMSGTYTLELITIDDDFLENFVKFKKQRLENDLFEASCVDFDKSLDDEKEQIMLDIEKKITKEIETIESYFKPIQIENPRKKKIIEEMDKMFSMPLMTEFIDFGLKFRDKKRIEESCPDQTFEKPKKIINLKELKNNIENIDDKLDEMLANISDSDNSDC